MHDWVIWDDSNSHKKYTSLFSTIYIINYKLKMQDQHAGKWEMPQLESSNQIYNQNKQQVTKISFMSHFFTFE